MQARIHILITGLVQGVSFRHEITNLSRHLGIGGSVRNLADGSVEVLAEGEKERLDELIQFCHIGPSGARVKSVKVDWSDSRGEYHGFRITR